MDQVNIEKYNGLDYREIAEIMAEDGTQMSFNGCRNHVVRSMNKIAKAIAVYYEYDLGSKQNIGLNANFQCSIIDLLKEK